MYDPTHILDRCEPTELEETEQAFGEAVVAWNANPTEENARKQQEAHRAWLDLRRVATLEADQDDVLPY